MQKYKQIDLLHISDQASIIKSSKAIVRQVSKEFFKTILQGRKKLFYGGAGGGGGGGGRLSKIVDRHGWPTLKNQSPKKRNLDQNINDSKSHI